MQMNKFKYLFLINFSGDGVKTNISSNFFPILRGFSTSKLNLNIDIFGKDEVRFSPNPRHVNEAVTSQREVLSGPG